MLKLLLVWDGGRLDQKFVATLDIERRVRLHGLEKYCVAALACAAVGLQAWHVPLTSKEAPGSIRPALGRTQYL